LTRLKTNLSCSINSKSIYLNYHYKLKTLSMDIITSMFVSIHFFLRKFVSIN